MHRLSKRTFITMIIVLFVVGCSGPGEHEIPAGPHPILILDIDSLRADHLGCYGYERETSPNIDALARESIVFEWAFGQAPGTAPSHASLLSGLYPTTHGMVDESTRLPEAVVTLAESLSEHGYATAAFVDGGYLGSEFGFDQGFTVFDNSRGAGLETVVPRAIDWLREHADENFLLLIHSNDPHVPYAPPAPYREVFAADLEPPTAGFEPVPERMEAVRTSLRAPNPQPLPPNDLEYARALYDGEIRLVDDWVGRLMDVVRELGLDRRATIVLVSNHGQEFQEHDDVLHEQLYTTVTRIPLILRLPLGRKAGRLTEIVEGVDLMPTLLELAGAAIPTPVQGGSLVPLIRNQGRPPYLAFGESPYLGRQRFVAMGGYRLILTRESGKAELYHLDEDPLELNDLGAIDSERVRVLLSRLDEWEERIAGASYDPEEQQSLDEDTLEQLKSLGYVQ